MRISDWSSDVCSSDLKVSGTDGNADFYASTAGCRWLAGEDLIERFVVPDGRGWTSHFGRRCGSPAPLGDATGKFFFVPAGLLDDDPDCRSYAAHKVGTASCRERVCHVV